MSSLQHLPSFALTFIPSKHVSHNSYLYSIDAPDGNPSAASNPPPNAERADSPVAQILEAIPAELYVANQQQWIGLRKNSKILPFCCR